MDDSLNVLQLPAAGRARAAFVKRVSDYLSRHEAENNLPLSVVVDIGDAATGRYQDARLWLAVDGGGSPHACLIWTPPFNLLTCYGDEPGARTVLLEALLDLGETPPGVTGPEPTAGEVAGWLARRSGVESERRMRQGVYRLTAVTPRPRAEGTIRRLQEADEGRFLPWLHAFAAEVGDQPRSAADIWRSFIDSATRRLLVYEVRGEPTCLVGVGGSTPNGRRIGPVYTPPEQRSRGYAEALVARVCQELLAAGTRFCFLYTDLDNPTANGVYRKVGFEQILESAEYELGARRA